MADHGESVRYEEVTRRQLGIAEDGSKEERAPFLLEFEERSCVDSASVMIGFACRK